MDAAALEAGIDYLTRVDVDLARIHACNGLPPAWQRPEGFATLVILVLEQQVSLASAAAAYQLLCDRLKSRPDPAGFLTLDDHTLRTIGFSRQKASYCRGIADGLTTGAVRLDDLNEMDDDAVRTRLLAIRGIGPWTADCYLLSALGRPDVWPQGDRALRVAVGNLKGWSVPPTGPETVPIAEAWRPWRSVAARMLWHDYLKGSVPPGMG